VSITIGAGIEDIDSPTNGQSRDLQVFDNGLSHRIVGIGKHGKARGPWQQLLQQPELLCPKFSGHRADTGDVTPRPVEAADETDLDRIDARAEYDRNRRGRRFGRERPLHAAWCGDDRHPAADQIGRQFRQPIVLILRPAVLDRHVLALDVAGFVQPFAKRRRTMRHRIGQTRFKISDDWHSRLLPTRRKWPRDPRTAEQCDELAPSQMIEPHLPPLG
jgi:hypothetical protein